MANLFCNPGKRVAIFSAFYGRTKYESVQCTQPNGVQDESKYNQRFFSLIIN